MSPGSVAPKVPRHILLVIIFSQFSGTSLWFAGNAVIGDLQATFALPPQSLGFLTSAVQLGFISGTLFFAFYSISDRVSPRKIFFLCSILGGLANLGIYWLGNGLISLMVLRFLTGFFLAGIYPVGMQIASGWFKEGLGNAIGWLVGALVLGTAFPHLIRSLGSKLPWTEIIISISFLSFLGGILMLVLVPDGPYLKRKTRFDPLGIVRIFKSPSFRGPALGYFGHMWELYAFWAFVPVFMTTYFSQNGLTDMDLSFWSFIIIGTGSLGCILGGMVSQRMGSGQVAFFQLSMSGLLCLFSPLLYQLDPNFFLGILMLWGGFVVGDSPQFSTLVARNAPEDMVGSSLTIVNSLGFLITIPSIQLISFLSIRIPHNYLLVVLGVGPVLGLLAMIPQIKNQLK